MTRVGAVEDGVRHVGRLGPGGPRVVDHRVQHLGGDDDRLGLLPAQLDRPLLHQRHAFERHLDAEVAAGDHDPVEGVDHGLDVVDGLGLLQLRDHRCAAPDPVHHRVDELDVGGRPHERQRDQVHAEAEGELEVRDVLLRQGGHRDVHAGQGQALVVRTPVPPIVTVQTTSGPSTSTTSRPTRPSSTSSRSPGFASVGQRRVGRRDPLGRAGHVVHGDAHGLAGVPVDRAVGEPAEPDLRALQVREDGDRAARARRPRRAPRGRPSRGRRGRRG